MDHRPKVPSKLKVLLKRRLDEAVAILVDGISTELLLWQKKAWSDVTKINRSQQEQDIFSC